jgi:hypothetical protein
MHLPLVVASQYMQLEQVGHTVLVPVEVESVVLVGVFLEDSTGDSVLETGLLSHVHLAVSAIV